MPAAPRCRRRCHHIISIADQHPALRALAGNVCLAGLALGVERVELLLQPLLGGLARLDGAAALELDLRLRRYAARLWFLRPKKMSPFQRVPVIARAIADSDL